MYILKIKNLTQFQVHCLFFLTLLKVLYPWSSSNYFFSITASYYMLTINGGNKYVNSQKMHEIKNENVLFWMSSYIFLLVGITKQDSKWSILILCELTFEGMIWRWNIIGMSKELCMEINDNLCSQPYETSGLEFNGNKTCFLTLSYFTADGFH